MGEKSLRKACFALMTVVVFIIGTFGSPHAEDQAAFYKGKVIQFIVGYSPGGGYDTYSRLMASAIQKYLDCKVVVRNMPGAGAILALNHLYLSAKRDGTVMMIGPVVNTQLSELLNAPEAKYKCQEFNWLGRITWEPLIFMVKRDSPYKSLDDLRKAEKLICPGPSPTSMSSLAAVLAAEALGLDNVKTVSGYPGSPEMILAVLRGQADFFCASVGTAFQHMEDLRPMFVIARKRVPDLPDVPALYETPIKQEVKDLLEIGLPLYEIGRSVITTPGVPAERVRFLRELFMKCVQDPEFVERSQKLDRSLQVLNGEEVEMLVNQIMAFPTEAVANFKHIVYEKYR